MDTTTLWDIYKGEVRITGSFRTFEAALLDAKNLAARNRKNTYTVVEQGSTPEAA